MTTEETEETKRCTRCRTAKPLTQFWRARGHADGRHSWCSTCHSAYKRDHLANDQQAKDRSRAIARAHQKALHQLKNLHQIQFKRLLAKAKQDEGLS